ncbi:ACT domain-containing protein [Cryptosporangium minutisporangium]|uniref:ACT domain-containing protein n=1 Tax=Cryptosporangium minutisporangium TaxID=113569 RepID=A0ABP6SWT2_9ACTN
MVTFVPQHLTLRPETFAIERHDTEDVVGTADWIALVRGPDGLTVIRTVTDGDDGWRAFQGQDAHELDVPGMLLSIITPLSEADLPIFAASTYAADLVLVPASHAEKAVALLRTAGHDVAE